MPIASGISHNFSSRKPSDYEEKYKELKRKYDELSEKYNELVTRHQRTFEELELQRHANLGHPRSTTTNAID